ncbi:hypothetical protein F5888DRAFT_1704767 [Russula emetica]|nr:hypothetical protein F5888DRAFT_1704767 [Russula emetica]
MPTAKSPLSRDTLPSTADLQSSSAGTTQLDSCPPRRLWQAHGGAWVYLYSKHVIIRVVTLRPMLTTVLPISAIGCFTPIYIVCHRLEAMRCTKYLDANHRSDVPIIATHPKAPSLPQTELRTHFLPSAPPASGRVPGVLVFHFVRNYYPADLLWHLWLSPFPRFLG